MDVGAPVAVGLGVCAGVTSGTGVVAPIVIGVGTGLSSQALRVLTTNSTPKTASLRVRRMYRLIRGIIYLRTPPSHADADWRVVSQSEMF